MSGAVQRQFSIRLTPSPSVPRVLSCFQPPVPILWRLANACLGLTIQPHRNWRGRISITGSPASSPMLVCPSENRSGYLFIIFPASLHVPSEILLVLPLLSGLSGLSHVGPVGQRLQQTADVLVLGPGGADGEFLLTLDNDPERQRAATVSRGRRLAVEEIKQTREAEVDLQGYKIATMLQSRRRQLGQ